MAPLRLIVRSLLRSPGFAVAAILSLALGIGSGAAAFSVIDAVRFRALPFKDGDRLVLISEAPVGPAGQPAVPCPGGCDVSYELFANLLKVHSFRSVDQVAGYTSGAKALNLGGEPILISGGVVSANLFDLLGAEPMLGRRIVADDDRLGAPPVTVISADLWRNQLGGRPDIVGQTVKLSDTRYTVVGVMPPGFEHEVNSQFWLASVPTLDPSTRPSIRSLVVVARLRPGATIAQFDAELASIDPALLTKTSASGTVTTALDALPLRERYVASTQSHDLIFAAVVAGIILIAATNLANLVLVRTLNQRRTFAIQSALGAGRGRIVRRMWAEHLVLVGIAAGLGLLFAKLMLGGLSNVAALQSVRPVGMDYQLDARAVGFAIALALLLAAVLSLVPARLMRGTDVQAVLRQGAPQSGGASWRGAQRVFVVAQLATAVVLLSGAALMAKTIFRLSELDVGFDAETVVEGSPSFPHPWRVKEKYLPVTRQIVTELSLGSGVARVAVRADAPLGVRGAPVMITLDGQANPLPANLVPRSGVAIDTGYVAALGLSVVKGRAFGPGDVENGPPVAMVNEWAAQHWWPGQDPIGKVIRVDTAPSLPMRLEIVGVLRNNRAAQPNLLLAQDGPEVYRPLEQAPSPYPTFLIRARGPVAPLLRPTKETLARLVPDRPLSATPFADRIDAQLAGVRTNGYQILAFAAVGLALALLGVYGVLSYAVGQRTQEIGIRGALGASRSEISRLVVLDGIRLAAIGVGIGLPLAGLATRGMAPLLHGTPPTDPAVLIGVAAGVVVVSMLASWWPARRAARVDPLVALRSN
jgi:predicted permease